MAVTFLVSKWSYLNSQRLYRPISRTFSQVTFGAFMTLESRKKSSHQCVLGIFGINQGPNSHKPDTYSTWTAHPSRLLGCAVPCRPLASFAESSWDANTFKKKKKKKKKKKRTQANFPSFLLSPLSFPLSCHGPCNFLGCRYHQAACRLLIPASSEWDPHSRFPGSRFERYGFGYFWIRSRIF